MYTNLKLKLFLVASIWVLPSPVLHAMMHILTKECHKPVQHTVSTQPIGQNELAELLEKRLSPSKSADKETFSIASTESPVTGNINSTPSTQPSSVSPEKELYTPPLYPARSLSVFSLEPLNERATTSSLIREESAIPLPPPAGKRSRASTDPDDRAVLFSSYLQRASTELLPSPKNQQEIALVLLKKIPHRRLSSSKSNTILAALAQDNLDRGVLAFKQGNIEQSRQYLDTVLEQKENEIAKHNAATLNYKLSLKETSKPAALLQAIAAQKKRILSVPQKKNTTKNKCLPWL